MFERVNQGQDHTLAPIRRQPGLENIGVSDIKQHIQLLCRADLKNSNWNVRQLDNILTCLVNHHTLAGDQVIHADG